MKPGLRVGDEVTLRDGHRSSGKVVMLSGSVVTVLLDDGEVVALAADFGERQAVYIS